MNEYQKAAVTARVTELRGRFDEWSLRREMQDRIILGSILKAWSGKGSTWQN